LVVAQFELERLKSTNGIFTIIDVCAGMGVLGVAAVLGGSIMYVVAKRAGK
jgi:16S rRNA G1207 methylase RsmC